MIKVTKSQSDLSDSFSFIISEMNVTEKVTRKKENMISEDTNSLESKVVLSIKTIFEDL